MSTTRSSQNNRLKLCQVQPKPDRETRGETDQVETPNDNEEDVDENDDYTPDETDLLYASDP